MAVGKSSGLQMIICLFSSSVVTLDSIDNSPGVVATLWHLESRGTASTSKNAAEELPRPALTACGLCVWRNDINSDMRRDVGIVSYCDHRGWRNDAGFYRPVAIAPGNENARKHVQ